MNKKRIFTFSLILFFFFLAFNISHSIGADAACPICGGEKESYLNQSNNISNYSSMEYNNTSENFEPQSDVCRTDMIHGQTKVEYLQDFAHEPHNGCWIQKISSSAGDALVNEIQLWFERDSRYWGSRDKNYGVAIRIHDSLSDAKNNFPAGKDVKAEATFDVESYLSNTGLNGAWISFNNLYGAEVVDGCIHLKSSKTYYLKVIAYGRGPRSFADRKPSGIAIGSAIGEYPVSCPAWEYIWGDFQPWWSWKKWDESHYWGDPNENLDLAFKLYSRSNNPEITDIDISFTDNNADLCVFDPVRVNIKLKADSHADDGYDFDAGQFVKYNFKFDDGPWQGWEPVGGNIDNPTNQWYSTYWYKSDRDWYEKSHIFNSPGIHTIKVKVINLYLCISDVEEFSIEVDSANWISEPPIVDSYYCPNPFQKRWFSPYTLKKNVQDEFAFNLRDHNDCDLNEDVRAKCWVINKETGMTTYDTGWLPWKEPCQWIWIHPYATFRPEFEKIENAGGDWYKIKIFTEDTTGQEGEFETRDLLIKPAIPEVKTEDYTYVSDTAVTMAGNLTWDGGYKHTRNYFEYGLWGSDEYETTEYISDLEAPPNNYYEFTQTNLEPATDYWYRAVSNTPYVGIARGEKKHFFTKPHPPIIFNAENAGEKQIDLDWIFPSDTATYGSRLQFKYGISGDWTDLKTYYDSRTSHSFDGTEIIEDDTEDVFTYSGDPLHVGSTSNMHDENWATYGGYDTHYIESWDGNTFTGNFYEEYYDVENPITLNTKTYLYCPTYTGPQYAYARAKIYIYNYTDSSWEQLAYHNRWTGGGKTYEDSLELTNHHISPSGNLKTRTWLKVYNGGDHLEKRVKAYYYEGYITEQIEFEINAGTYYFRIYSLACSNYDGCWYQSEDYALANAVIYEPPVVFTLDPNVGTYEFTARGYLETTGVGTDPCDAYFAYGMDGDCFFTTSKQTIYEDTTYDKEINQMGMGVYAVDVEPGTLYAYRALAENPARNAEGKRTILMTKPEQITQPILDFIPEDNPPPPKDNLKVGISWTSHEGADGAYIEWINTTPPDPWNPGDGYKINGTDFFYDTEKPLFHDGLSANTTYYYKIWAAAEDTINLDGNITMFRSNGTNNFPFANGVVDTITTPPRPKAPENLFLPRYGKYEAHLTWDKGERADKTKITAQKYIYPYNRDLGRTVYEDYGNNTIDNGFEDYSIQHYRAYSYNETYKLWSTTYDEINTSVIDFQLTFPQYLDVGDYIISWGKLISQTGQNVEGFITTTTIQNLSGDIVEGPVQWNCSDGNFQTTISTTTMTAGTYNIVSEFENKQGTKFIFKYISKLYLSSEGNETDSYYTRANIHYTFYDVETGTGLDDNYYRVYISEDQEFNPGDRVKGGKIGVVRSKGTNVYVGKKYYMQITDFNGNIIPIGQYDEELDTYDDGLINNAYIGFNVTQPEVYIDAGVYLNQFRVKNMNDTTVYMSLKRIDGESGQIWGRFIPPWEETEIFIADGTYNLTLDYYNNTHPEWGPLKREHPWENNIEIDTDLFYHIKGRDLDDVCHKIRGAGTYIYYSIFDMNTGGLLGDDFYRVYFSDDENITAEDRVLGGEYSTQLWNRVYYKIEDYWGNKIYPYNSSESTSTVIQSEKTFLDIGIPLNQFKMTNQNNSLVYARITTGSNFSQYNTWYNRWIAPGENTNLFLRSDTYNISLEYYYPNNGSLIGFRNISNFKIESDLMFNIPGSNDIVYFNIYDSSTGTSKDYKSLKIYCDGIRINKNYMETYIGNTLEIKINDYFNNTLYSGDLIVTDNFMYVDIPIKTFNLKFANYKDEPFVVGIKNNNSVTWLEEIITSYETIEYNLGEGNYSIRFYNSTFQAATIYRYLNSSAAYIIDGADLDQGLTLILDGQNTSINTSFSEMVESHNLTDSMLYQLLGEIPYRNETISSVSDEFRKPHVYEISVLKGRYSDELAPITTITAVVTIDGGITVKWSSTDNSDNTVDSVRLFYKIQNASWKEWDNNLTRSGKKTFKDEETTLNVGENYSFMALATDTAGNIEEPNEMNTVTLQYSLIDIDKDGIDLINIMKDTLFDWTFIMVAIAIVGCIAALYFIEKRKDKREMKEMERTLVAYRGNR